MPETIQEYNGKYNWPILNILEDLVNQGGLKEEDILSNNDYELFYKGEPFVLDHNYKQGLKVASMNESETLINAFSKILELKPFCKYITVINKKSWTVYEWNKLNPMMRYFDLNNKEGVIELKEL